MAHRNGLTHKELAQLTDVLAAEATVLFAYLFGSQAKGTASPASDIDLAVYLNNTGLREVLVDARITDALVEAVGRDVDLVILNRTPLFLQFRIITEGRLLKSQAEAERVNFEAHTAKMFLDFKPLHDEYLRFVRERARRGRLSHG